MSDVAFRRELKLSGRVIFNPCIPTYSKLLLQWLSS